MRSQEEYRQAIRLIEDGINDCEIGRRLGIPRGTIKTWRLGRQAGSGGHATTSSGPRATCFRCDGGWLDEEAYAYLLGVYLGDGWIWDGPKNVYQLRVTCDLRYPEIIEEIASHIVIVRGVEKVGFARREDASMSMPTGSTGRVRSPNTERGANVNVVDLA